MGSHGLFLNHIHYRSPRYEAIGAFLVILASAYYFSRTASGLKLKALAENPSLLEICGINSERLRLFAWFIAGGLAGVAGIISPYMYKGEFGRDVELLFVPMVVASILAEKREPWVAGLTGLVVGFSDINIVTMGQSVLGVWFGEYRNIVEAFFLVVLLFVKERRISLPNWLSPRRLSSYPDQP
jgi:branched-chain amino acid transport system permease protein